MPASTELSSVAETSSTASLGAASVCRSDFLIGRSTMTMYSCCLRLREKLSMRTRTLLHAPRGNWCV